MFIAGSVIHEITADATPLKRAFQQGKAQAEVFGADAARAVARIDERVVQTGLNVDGLANQFSRATRLFGASAMVTAGLNAIAVGQGIFAANTMMANAAIDEQIAGVERMSAAVSKVPFIGGALADVFLSGRIEDMRAAVAAADRITSLAEESSRHMRETHKWIEKISESADLPLLNEAEKLERTVQRMRSDLAKRLEGPGFTRNGELTASGVDERRRGLEAIATFERAQNSLLFSEKLRLDGQLEADRLRLIGRLGEAERMEFQHTLDDRFAKLHAFSPEASGAFLGMMDDSLKAFDLRGMTELSAALDQQEGLIGRTAAQWEAYKVSISGAAAETIREAAVMAQALDERAAGLALADVQRQAERINLSPMEAQVADFAAMGATESQIEELTAALDTIERHNALKEVEHALVSLQTPMERLTDQAEGFAEAFGKGLIDERQLEFALSRLDEAMERLDEKALGGIGDLGSDPRLATFMRAGSVEAAQLAFQQQAGGRQDEIPRRQLTVAERTERVLRRIQAQTDFKLG